MVATCTWVGGPKTIETFRAIGALDELRLMVLPLLVGGGRQLTPDLDVETALQFVDVRAWPHGVLEIGYAVTPPL